MAGFVPPPHQTPTTGGSHLVFVPVDGRLVFLLCLLLIAACAVWCLLLWQEGKRRRDE